MTTPDAESHPIGARRVITSRGEELCRRSEGLTMGRVAAEAFREVRVAKFMTSLALGLAGLASTAAMAGNGYGYGYGRGDYYYGSGFYIGASAGEIFYKEQGLDTMVPGVAFLQIGQQFNPYLAIEGRVGGGISGDNFQFFHVDVPLVYGGYVKGMLPATPWFSGLWDCRCRRHAAASQLSGFQFVQHRLWRVWVVSSRCTVAPRCTRNGRA